MKFTVMREQVLEPVSCAERVTGKNLTLPVLSCILLSVHDGVLAVTATNLEVGVRYTIPVLDAEDGSVAVSGAVLSHVLTALPQGSSVTFSALSGNLTIESAGANSRIALQDTHDFPNLPQVEDGATLVLPVKEFKDTLSSVAYCCSSSTIKPELASVFVHADGSVLVGAATDSFRLAEKRVPLKDPVTAEPFLVPARSVAELIRILDRVADSVEVCVSSHQLSLSCKGVYLTLRLTAGTFPDYAQVIPKEFSSEATMLLFDIERALRKASVFSDQFNQTTITLDPKKKSFVVHTASATVGETTDSVAAALTGSDLVIKFNQRYLIDAFVPVKTDSVTMQFAGQGLPAVVRPVGDETFRYLVMPMNR